MRLAEIISPLPYCSLSFRFVLQNCSLLLTESSFFRNESVQQLEEIANSQWINECTREFTVEFTVYTPFLRAIR